MVLRTLYKVTGKMQYAFVVSISFFIFSLCLGCNKKEPEKQDGRVNQSRIISFSGYLWEVKSSGSRMAGPGPNYFSDSEENVSVDNQGKLHLRITYRNGKWYCAEVTLLKSPGHGHYGFCTSGRIDTLDKNSVVGLFLYRNDSKEIDMEFSRWGVDQQRNVQYVVQPGDSDGNKHKFILSLQDKELASIINWQSGFIGFYNYKGNLADTISDNNLIEQWIYNGPNNPSEEDDLATKIVFWLFKGKAPSHHNDIEIVVSSFKYF